MRFFFFLLFLDMLAHSPKDRSRSPQRTNGNQNETSGTTTNNKSKKENESQARMKTLKVRSYQICKDSSDIIVVLLLPLGIYSNIKQ